jgi:glycopeptide antibiotics resistance protein
LSIKHARIIRAVSWILFIFYLAVLMYFLFFAEAMGRSFDTETYHYNLYPLKEIRRFLTYRETLGMDVVLLNLVGNIVAFMPFGMIPPIIHRKFRHSYVMILLSMDFSLTVEVVQLISKAGSFDVDDILLNTIGGAIGYLIFAICNYLRRKYYG